MPTFTSKKPKATPAAKATSGFSAMGGDDGKPELLEGWVEKKGGGRVKMGDGWQKRYLRIDEENACLSYYKSSRLVSIFL